jgi:hypothetical protein
VPDHRHDSLPQLLVNGLVELPLDLPLLQHIAAASTALPYPVETVLLVRDFDPQTAGRPPPAFSG